MKMTTTASNVEQKSPALTSARTKWVIRNRVRRSPQKLMVAAACHDIN